MFLGGWGGVTAWEIRRGGGFEPPDRTIGVCVFSEFLNGFFCVVGPAAACAVRRGARPIRIPDPPPPPSARRARAAPRADSCTNREDHKKTDTITTTGASPRLKVMPARLEPRRHAREHTATLRALSTSEPRPSRPFARPTPRCCIRQGTALPAPQHRTGLAVRAKALPGSKHWADEAGTSASHPRAGRHGGGWGRGLPGRGGRCSCSCACRCYHHCRQSLAPRCKPPANGGMMQRRKEEGERACQPGGEKR